MYARLFCDLISSESVTAYAKNLLPFWSVSDLRRL
jgi:hypothetical protein